MIKLFEAGKQSRANISSLSKDINLPEGYLNAYKEFQIGLRLEYDIFF